MQTLWKKFLNKEVLKEQVLALTKVPEIYINHAEWEFRLGIHPTMISV
jgi:hypothetical protein